MAKLSARGRTELARVSKESAVTDPTRSTDWERTTIALMSDSKILSKLDVRFKAETIAGYERAAYKHSYGWTVKARLKAGYSAEEWVTKMLAAGYTKESK